ncbi:hypothetical protein [Cellulomonas sp. PS-H5]|uniref:hypothetical protein n=1 Tax=Cellulomonas sp. PS-H5 TaxID=2820400 RepID=UPI001C502360|nr:hypothetical protein [Cellulomonas sp. PS-H5]MBW0255677.1 hypothetical protein [Cellulomonas sp. PS-H5]
MPRRRPPSIPGLVEHREPLAPGEAHVDPADPRGLARRAGDGSDWFSWRAELFSWVAAVLAVVEVVLAVRAASWRPLGAAALLLLAAAVAWRTRTRYDRSPRGRRDMLRMSGGLFGALLVFFVALPFLAP